jgi:hypothetical protein
MCFVLLDTRSNRRSSQVYAEESCADALNDYVERNCGLRPFLAVPATEEEVRRWDGGYVGGSVLIINGTDL